MKRQTLLGLGAMLAIGMTAAPLSPEQALSRISGTQMGKVGISKMEQTPVLTVKSEDGTPSVYVFNTADGKGFKVLSADDCAYAVLGYSDSGSIDPSNVAPAFKWWIEEQGRAISYYASRGAKPGAASPKALNEPAIPMLCATTWDQGSPYNLKCPTLNSRATYTGCVATSMSQVMKYHNYPEKGVGTASYGWTKGEKILTLDLSKITFDWDNMLNRYSSSATTVQKNAVATLMQAAGYAVEMNYGTDASGTQGALVADALIKYFNYDKGCHVEFRTVYSASEWERRVYDNLKNCGPLVFNGHPYQSAGHSFVCDGYDGQGYFHINWGWSGMSDGYYLLDVMSPGAQGAGGSTGETFNYGLNGIFGIQPPTGQDAPVRYDNILHYGPVTATYSGKALQFYQGEWYPKGWFCGEGHTVKVNMGCIIEPVDGTPGEVIQRGGTFNGGTYLVLNPGAYYPESNGPKINIPSLPDGRYKVSIACRDMNVSDAPYVEILHPYGCPNHVFLNVVDGEITVENVAVPSLEIENAEATSEFYAGKNCRISLKVKNDSEYELTESIQMGLLIDGVVKMTSGLTPTTVPSNGTYNVEMITKFQGVTGFGNPSTDTEFTLASLDNLTGEVLATFGKVIMHKRQVVSSKLSAEEFVIENVTPESENTEWGQLNVYNVPNANDFVAKLVYKVTSGYFDGYVSMGIYERVDSEYLAVMTGLGQYMPFIDQGEKDTMEVPIDFTEAEVGKYYALRANFASGNSEKQLAEIMFKVKSVGVDGIEIDTDDAEVEYYNLQGVRIANPQRGQLVIRKAGDKTSKVIF